MSKRLKEIALKQLRQAANNLDAQNYEVHDELCGKAALLILRLADRIQHGPAYLVAWLAEEVDKLNDTTTPQPITPGPLSEGDKANFETLQKAMDNRDVVLVSAIRKADGKQVGLVCALNHNDDETISPAPLAVMIEGNPYEDFLDPTV